MKEGDRGYSIWSHWGGRYLVMFDVNFEDLSACRKRVERMNHPPPKENMIKVVGYIFAEGREDCRRLVYLYLLKDRNKVGSVVVNRSVESDYPEETIRDRTGFMLEGALMIRHPEQNR